MATDHSKLTCFWLLFSFFTSSARSLQFLVGGNDGWGLNPSEKFNQWAERMRFQVNDTLLFKYKKESDSVLVVSRDDYYKCQTGSPIIRFVDGNSVFKFDRSGPFFFISGKKSNCNGGQKLIVVVLAVRSGGPQIPSPYPSPPEGVSPPSPAEPPSPNAYPAPSPHSKYPPEGVSPSPSGPFPSPAESPSDHVNPSPAPPPPDAGDSPPDAQQSQPPPSFAPHAFTPSFFLISAVSLLVVSGLGFD